VKVQIKLLEASPSTLWTQGEVKNVSASGAPTVALAKAAIRGGTRFLTGPGLHAYRFLIEGEGTIKVQAFDASTDRALAPAATFDTTEVHGGHTYVFGVA
jgi:hypothetical protein